MFDYLTNFTGIHLLQLFSFDFARFANQSPFIASPTLFIAVHQSSTGTSPLWTIFFVVFDFIGLSIYPQCTGGARLTLDTVKSICVFWFTQCT